MRDCGSCDACCIIPSIPGLKPVNSVCPNLDQSKSCNKCKIYKIRPPECSSFDCMWIRGFGDEYSQPNTNNVLTTIKEFNNGVWIIAVEMAPNAVMTTGRNIIVDLAEKYELPVIIQSFDGIETGDRTVIKNSLLRRAETMTGDFIAWLDDNETIGIYTLVNNI